MSSSSSSSLSSSSSSSSASAATYSRGIRLWRKQQSRYIAGTIDGFRFTVQAYGEYLMPRQIFRFLQYDIDPVTGEKTASFDGVCSSVDLEEYPIGGPLDGQNPPYFRGDTVDIVLRSRSEADKVWQAIQEDVTTLVLSLNLAEEMDVDGSFDFGNPPPSDPPA